MSVFVVHPINDKGVDISAAKVYGELSFINPRYIYIDELSDGDLPTDYRSKMMKVVDQWDPEEDYLLIAGDHLQIIAMSALLAARWGVFMALRYDRQAKGYAVANIETRDA